MINDVVYIFCLFVYSVLIIAFAFAFFYAATSALLRWLTKRGA